MFRGVITALVSPFQDVPIADDERLPVDWDATKRLIDLNVDAGNTILLLGTTGESPTFDHKGHLEFIERGLEFVNGRVPVIAGTGGNDTVEAIHLSRGAVALGVDGLLIVDPYYNKPPQDELFKHHRKVANAVSGTPVIPYIIPARSVVYTQVDKLADLVRECDNVVDVKDAVGDIEVTKELIEVLKGVRPDFSVLSGNDGMAYETIKAGGDGIVSVVSNVAPHSMAAMVRDALGGNDKGAKGQEKHLKHLYEASMMVNNPMAIKHMLYEQGHCHPVCRSPLDRLDSVPGREVPVKDLMAKAGMHTGMYKRWNQD